MNTCPFSATVLCLVLSASLQAQEMDKEISAIATKLATLAKDNGTKKVTVLDFTDLQGNESELGKYVAEQLTVELVMVKTNFSVLDRANLRKILAEHKLSATGLVDPDNAKKLGQFAGVDALILGTIVPKHQTVALTAKIITTDTAEVVGAAKAEFKSDEAVQTFLSKAAKTEVASETSAPDSRRSAPIKPFGDLVAKVESLRLLPRSTGYRLDGSEGSVSFTLIIMNTNSSTTHGIALHANNFRLSNSRDDQFFADQVQGIESVHGSGTRYQGTLTDIPPKTSLTITGTARGQWTGKAGDYRPYRLQTVLVLGELENGAYSNLRKHNLVLDIK